MQEIPHWGSLVPYFVSDMCNALVQRKGNNSTIKKKQKNSTSRYRFSSCSQSSPYKNIGTNK